ncbi:MAG: HAD family hydrolase [Planctomycetes bacterium]|nr:HAD family hydrolase [Planctomycetota bacterium]
MTEAVAFDLDDTLFLEREYVRSGFDAVAGELDREFGGGRDWLDRLWRDFEAGVRGDAFNRVLRDAGLSAGDELIHRLVSCYREHEPQISLCDDVLPAVGRLNLPPEKVGVITDGPVAMQQRKFEALELGRWVGHAIYTDRWGEAFRKPHPRAFEEFERLVGCPSRACAYVSDNPRKDFQSPHARGWTTVRIVRPGGLHGEEPSVPGEVGCTISTFDELPAALGLGL